MLVLGYSIKLLKDICFSIDIQINLKEVDFLDVKLNQLNQLIVHPRNLKISCFTSTHHQTIHRKSLISLKLHLWKTAKNYSNQEIFNTAKLEYKDELKKSSYVDLKYTNSKSEKLKTRKRNIIWLNSSFSKSVSTNVAKTFLQLVTKHFARSHNKIFKFSTKFSKFSIQLK